MYLKQTPNRNLPWQARRPSSASVERRTTSRLHFIQYSSFRSRPRPLRPLSQTVCGKPPAPKCKLRYVPMVDISVDSATFSSSLGELGLLLRLISLRIRRFLSQASVSFRPLPPAFRLPST